MASYRAGNVPDQNCMIDNDQTYEGMYQGIVELLDGPQWTARQSKMGLLETYQFEARTGKPVRDLKGGACSLHLESDACCFPALPRPLNFASNCGCQCSCSPCPPSPCPPSPPCCNPCPPCSPCPRPVESCLPGLHQTYRDRYPDCQETHLPSGYRDFVEHDDLYLPPSRPLSAASNYCNRATSSRSWSPPSPSPQLKCHCGAAQYQSAQLRPGPTWDMPESKPCFQTFFQASPSPRGSPPRHPSRCESLYLVETPQQGSPRHPHSKPTSPVQPRSEVKDVMNISCQWSPRIDTDSGPKSFQTRKSGASSPLPPCNLEFSTNFSPYSRAYYPSSLAYYPSKPMGFPESCAAELVTVEKHVQCNCTCSPQLEPVEFDEPYSRKPSVKPSIHDSGASIRRVLHPSSPLDLARSSSRLECTMNSEAPSDSRPLQCGNGHHDAAEKPSACTPQHDTSPPPESEEDCRYGPGQAVVPKAAELAKRTFNKRDFTSLRQPSREVIRRCCCGVCKSTYSRSHFTTKCPFCANAHSCCCGMCSCPFPSCTSKSPILDSSNTSNNTSTTSSPDNYRIPFHNNHPGYSSRPKSLSPMRKTYLAGLDNSYRQRSKSSRAKCKLQQRAFEPSPRALLESFHNYLKSESRRAKAGSSPHRRCSDRRSTHWKHTSPDRTCSQRTQRVNTRKAPRGPQQQQAPWGTHPILLSSRAPNLEYRLPYSGSHRGCCCSRCVNGKL